MNPNILDLVAFKAKKDKNTSGGSGAPGELGISWAPSVQTPVLRDEMFDLSIAKTRADKQRLLQKKNNARITKGLKRKPD